MRTKRTQRIEDDGNMFCESQPGPHWRVCLCGKYFRWYTVDKCKCGNVAYFRNEVDEPLPEGYVEYTGPTSSHREEGAGADEQPHEGTNVEISQDSTDGYMFDLDYFRNFRDFTDGYKQHNIALKWFREFGQREEMPRVDMDNDGPMQVPICDHPQGMSWAFDTTRTKPWRWQEMVAQLDFESTRHVVEGPQVDDLKSMTVVAGTCEKPCLIGCYLAKTDKYDHKRHSALRDNVTYHIWDFVLVRNNGTTICLHPDFASTTITSYEGDAPSDHEVPASGKGGTSGPGTYKCVRWQDNEKTLSFDPGRRN